MRRRTFSHAVRSWASMVLGGPSKLGVSMILCLKVKFFPFYTPTEVGGMLPWGCAEWCHVHPGSRVGNESTWCCPALWQLPVPRESPWTKRTNTRHNDLQEMSVFKHCFMSWDPAFKYLFLFSLAAFPGCHLHLLREENSLWPRVFISKRPSYPGS